jgi:hypothetical protein
MKWEPNIVGHPINVWQKQGAATPVADSVPANQDNPVTVRSNLVELSDNVLLAHYQRDRR